MADRLHSYDEKGPLLDLGAVHMWLEHDPLGIGKQERFDFTLPLFQLWGTESQFVCKIDDTTIKTGSEYNDFYGFGTSRRQATAEAVSFSEKTRSAKWDIRVQTKVFAKPTLHDAREPAFYNKTVRCFSLPDWRWKTAGGASITDALGGEATFCIWLNGAETEEWAVVQSLIERITAQDGASHIRKSLP